MDVLNFISWLKSKRQVTTVNASQTLIPLGLKDARRSDGYLPGAISVDDLLALSPGLPSFVEYDETNKTLWNSGTNSNSLNTSFGKDALTGNPGGHCTAIGERALAMGTGSFNTAIGGYAISNLITGSYNTALGAFALAGDVTNDNNTAIGFSCLATNTGGGYNVGVGNNALLFNTNGVTNTGIGMQALANNTTGDSNTAVGHGALYGNTVYGQSVGIGYSALENNNKGGNTAVGYCALRFNQGWRNIAVGNSGIDSGFAAASDNISIGNQTFQSLTTGEFNIGIGTSVMNSCNTGSNNTVIGAYSTSLNFSNTVVIGRDAVPTVNNQLVIGSNTYNVGAIATEALVPTESWAVRINGVNYKIPLQIA